MSRATRFVKEALILIGEADDPNLMKDDAAADATSEEPVVTDDTAGVDDLDLGAEPEDEFGLGASTAPTVRIEKDGPITVNKGDIQLSIGDDGAIDISLDGGGLAEEPAAPVDDMSDKPADGEASPEEDDYNIDWNKEKEGEEVPGAPKESLKDGEGTKDKVDEAIDLEGNVISALNKKQSPATTGAEFSKAQKVLNMGTNSGDIVTECKDKMYECMSCECYDECQDKGKKKVPEDDEKDFLTQGYM